MKVNSTWCRAAMAVAAVLAVAAPGLVLAAGPGTTYAPPRMARIVGSATVTHNTPSSYSLFVTFTDGSTATFNGSPATFSATKGSFTGNVYMAPVVAPSPPYDALHATYSNSGYKVTANRVITIL